MDCQHKIGVLLLPCEEGVVIWQRSQDRSHSRIFGITPPTVFSLFCLVLWTATPFFLICLFPSAIFWPLSGTSLPSLRLRPNRRPLPIQFAIGLYRRSRFINSLPLFSFRSPPPLSHI